MIWDVRKKRPDMVCDLGSHILIIECDENKHKHGDYSCENKRIMELNQDFSENNIHRPIVVIRFNPDTYIDSNNQKIESCCSFSISLIASLNLRVKSI